MRTGLPLPEGVAFVVQCLLDTSSAFKNAADTSRSVRVRRSASDRNTGDYRPGSFKSSIALQV